MPEIKIRKKKKTVTEIINLIIEYCPDYAQYRPELYTKYSRKELIQLLKITRERYADSI